MNGLKKKHVSQFETIVALARYQAQTIADKQFVQWLGRGNVEAGSYTYATLDCSARALAVTIQRSLTNIPILSSHNKQQAALIVVQPGLSFVVSFFACLYAGVIAVPTYPPKKNESIEALVSLINDAEIALIITDEETERFIEKINYKTSKIPFVLSSNLDKSLATLWEFPDIDRHSIAFYQYTSGSTGTPKGVVISHRNLMANQKMISHSMNHTSDSIIVGWLPMFHDMGLIGNLLQPFYLGARCILMSPASFIMNPIRWLEAITKYKATSSGGPNFAYDLCVNRTTPKQRENIDLSSWRIAFNGAEPVRAETIKNFFAVYSKHKFNNSSLYPCYGIAESTLLVSGAQYNAVPKILEVDKQALACNEIVIKSKKNNEEQISIASLVSSGIACENAEIKIVDPKNKTEKTEKSIGEIWVKSESVAREYKGKPQLTRETFQAEIRGQSCGSTYLRTGDLGFVNNAELYVTGRLKDLIIVSGKNHYPQDIEHTALASDAILARAMAAAFSIECHKKEQLVVIVSIKKNVRNKIDISRLCHCIKTAITRIHNVKVFDLLFVLQRLPTTSSGKIRRSKCRELYQNSEFKEAEFDKKEVFYDAKRAGNF